MVSALVSESDAARAGPMVGLAAVPKLTVPFGLPPAGSAGPEAVAQLNLRELQMRRTKVVVEGQFKVQGGQWTCAECR